MDRLFVPLNTEPWQWFRDGLKLYELRPMRGQYTPKHVRSGRRVELRRGYSTPDSLWGDIDDVRTYSNIEKAINDIGEMVIPGVACSNNSERIERAQKILNGWHGRVIAFSVAGIVYNGGKR